MSFFLRFSMAVLLLHGHATFAQQLTQTVRGTVYDQVTHVPLPGVNVVVTGTDPVINTVTDMDGRFRLEKVPVGKQQLVFRMLGYEERVMSALEITSGKELVLPVYLDEKLVQAEEVTITAERKKEVAQNEMALASTRTFSVEETQKFAAAVNDPARMAVSFAGVVSADDGNNNISIRGNNPNGLQWRMEGLEIPNPNHFSAPGTAGGGISILSSQLLTNSDFLTGAFPAEYGNALSGVFDLKLRKGNNERKEFTLQAGFLGLDLSAEGPVKQNYGGSYLVNYRYSTLSLIQHLVDIGEGVTNFQDLAFNVHLPAGKKHSFSVFGFAGLSSQKYDAVKDSVKWKEDGGRYGSDFISNTVTAGLTHSVILGNNTWLRNAVSYSYQHHEDNTTWLSDDYTLINRFNSVSNQARVTVQSILNHKFSSRTNLRAGIISNNYSFLLEQHEFDLPLQQMQQQLNSSDHASAVQAFAALSYRVSEKVTLLPGFHYQQYLLNSTASAEPRLAVKYAPNTSNSFTLGYGRHGQLQPVSTYFALDTAGKVMNRDLGYSKADHLVLAYDRMLNQYLHVKLETYYQQLSDIPVGILPGSSFSMVNIQWSNITEPLANKGEGRNYGLELTLEQFMKKNLYFLLSASLFNSEYTDQKGTWRSTRFNTGHAVTFTGGKEWAVGNPSKNRMLGVNLKVIWAGGMRQSPVDLQASIAEGETVFVENKLFTLQNPDYFRTDFKVSLKRNRPQSTHTLALDLQNATNHRNIYGKFFDDTTGKIKTYYQTPLIPVLSYKVQF